MGVSGFLISWATRCATSFHANCRCARSSSVVSSTTSTDPACPWPSSSRALVMARWMVRPAGMELNLSGGRAHAMPAPDDAGQIVGALGGQQRLDAFAGQSCVFR